MNRGRQMALAAGVLVLLAAWDFFGRVYVGRDESLRSFEPPPEVALPVRADAATVRSEVVAWMPALAGSAGVAASPTDPSGWVLTLVGVFRKDDGEFAVVHARPRSGSAEAQLHWVRAGDELHGSTVAEIGRRKLRLARDGESQELILFEQGRTPLISAGTGSPGVAPVVRPGGVASNKRGSGGIEQARARLRANQTKAAQQRSAPPASKTAAPPKSPAVSEPERSPGAADERQVAKPQELAPGEEVKLPWDLPVVEDGGTRPEKRP